MANYGLGCGYTRATLGRGVYTRLGRLGKARLGTARRAQAQDEVGRGETKEEMARRRARESAKVEDRLKEVYTQRELQQCLDEAGERLVVLEVDSDTVCESSLDEPLHGEVQWKVDEPTQEEMFQPCLKLRSTLQRCARECDDVEFLHLSGDMSDETRALSASLGVVAFPTLLFYKQGRLVYQQSGSEFSSAGLGEGVLYYGSRFAGGADSQRHVPDVASEAELASLVRANADAGRLFTVVACSETLCEPCVRVFPAVLALAKSLGDHVGFCRMMPDDAATCAFYNKRKVENLPTFLFVVPDDADANGIVEQRRLVTASRGDLMGNILQVLPPHTVTSPARA